MKSNQQFCLGPCLPQCATDQRFIYLLIGFLLGIICYYIVERFIISDYNDIKAKEQKEKNKNN